MTRCDLNTRTDKAGSPFSVLRNKAGSQFRHNSCNRTKGRLLVGQGQERRHWGDMPPTEPFCQEQFWGKAFKKFKHFKKLNSKALLCLPSKTLQMHAITLCKWNWNASQMESFQRTEGKGKEKVLNVTLKVSDIAWTLLRTSGRLWIKSSTRLFFTSDWNDHILSGCQGSNGPQVSSFTLSKRESSFCSVL